MTRNAALAAALAAVLVLSVLATSLQSAGIAWADRSDDHEDDKQQHKERHGENKKHDNNNEGDNGKGSNNAAGDRVAPPAAAVFAHGNGNEDDNSGGEDTVASSDATFALKGKGLAVWRSGGGTVRSADGVLNLTGDATDRGEGETKVFAEGTLAVGSDQYRVYAEGKAKMFENDMGMFRVKGKALKGGEELRFQLGGVLIPAAAPSSGDGQTMQWKFVADPAARLGRSVRIFALSGDLSVNATTTTTPTVPPPPSGGGSDFDLDRFRISTIGNQVAGQEFTFIVTAVDRLGRIKTDYAGQVALSTNDGASPSGGLLPSIAPSPYTFTSADAGQHVFVAKMYNAKTGGVTITVTGSGKTATSNAFAVGSAQAATVTVSPSPVSLAPMASAPVQARATDAYGNPVPTAGFTWSATPASIGTVAVNATDSSRATFTAASTPVAVNGTLTATTAAGISGSAPVAVNPVVQTLDRLRISAIGNQTAGQQFTFIVTALDGSGNIMRNFNGTVAVSTNNAPSPRGNASSILPATYTFVPAADEGQHVFVAKMYNARSDTTVTVSGGGKTATSNAFAVTPAPVATVEVSPASASVNVGSSVVLTATARDAYGNQVTSSGATYTWALGNSTAGSLVPSAAGTTATFTGSAAAGASSSVTATVASGGSSASGTATVNVNPA
jgi:hypothetical protein